MTCIGIALMAYVHSHAQEPIIVEDFQLHDTRSGKDITLSEYNDQKAIVVIFTSSDCAFSLKYQERINELYQTYEQQSVAFVAVNSNDSTLNIGDAPKKMRVQAPYRFPYLKDGSQQVAEQFGASRNPEVFVLTPVDDGKFRVVYQGQIDDNPLDASLVEHHYLKDAIEAVQAGSLPKVSSTEPAGCNIKWKKS